MDYAERLVNRKFVVFKKFNKHIIEKKYIKVDFLPSLLIIYFSASREKNSNFKPILSASYYIYKL
jgi:hypothetical protein